MTDNKFNVSPNLAGLPLLLTIAQVAELLNLGRTKTIELLMSNRINSVKVGRRRLIPRESLEKFVTELSNESCEE